MFYAKSFQNKLIFYLNKRILYLNYPKHHEIQINHFLFPSVGNVFGPGNEH